MVLHTKPRAEKALARKLLKRHVPFFLPLYERQWLRHARRFRSHVPLFSGYLFIYCDEQNRVTALESNLVIRTLHVGDQEQLRGDLTRVHQLITSGQELGPQS